MALAVNIVISLFLSQYTQWPQYKKQFHKKYSSSLEESMAFVAYMQNGIFISQHNQNSKRTYSLAHNKYSDKFQSSFDANMLGLISQGEWSSKSGSYKDVSIILPKSFNWTKEGAVTTVKDQDMCASSYAFAVVAALEGYLPLWLNQNLIDLSPKEIIDCTNKKGNFGCKGGRVNVTYGYVQKNKGINSLKDYPYKPTAGICKKKSKKYAPIGGYGQMPSNEVLLQKALYLDGPMVVGIDASQLTFQLYANGVYNDPECNKTNLNHAMLLVGWGEQNGLEFWLLKNSWGTTWGERGYIKILRGKDVCGLSRFVTFPVIPP